MSVRHNQMFEKSVIVVAHLDDEILWFSSVLEKVDETIACFLAYPSAPSLEQGAGCSGISTEYFVPGDRPGSFNTANWNTRLNHPLASILRTTAPSKFTSRTITGFVRGSRPRCVASGICTHNPWGEYGHEDHAGLPRQKAVQTQALTCGSLTIVAIAVRADLDHIARLNPEYITLPTNRALARDITDLYKKHNCWTWYDDHDWFKDECFLTDIDAVRNTRNHGHSFPINMLKTDFPESVDQRGWFECFITGLFSRGKTTN